MDGDRHQAALVTLLREALVITRRPKFLRSAVNLVGRTLDAERAEVLTFRSGGHRLALEASCGAASAAQGGTLVPRLAWNSSAILSASNVVPLDSLQKEDPAGSTGEQTPKGPKGIASVIRFRGKPNGILAVSARRPEGFTPQDGHFLASAARTIESYLERILLHEEERHVDERLHVSLQQIKKSHLWLNAALQAQNRELETNNEALRREVKERWRAESDLRLLVEVTAAAAEARDLPAMLGACLETICNLKDWHVGQAWIVDRGTGALVCSPDAWHAKIEAGGFRLASLATPMARGVGWPGQIWETGEPSLLPDLAKTEGFLRAGAASACGLQSAFGFPISAAQGTVAVLEFLSTKTRPADEQLPGSIGQLGSHLGIVFERLQSDAALLRARGFVDRLIHSSQEGILAFDRDFLCTVWNPAMEHLFGLPETQALGRSVFELLPFLSETVKDGSFRDVLEGKSLVSKERSYTLPEGGGRGFFQSYYSPIWEQKGAGVGWVIGGLAIVHDITGRRQAEESFRELSHRLLKLQEEERSRIARELHDSTAQTLTAASLSLVRLEQVAGALVPAAAEALAETKHWLGEAGREIRSISYLIYPPELGSMGLAEALRAYAEGFGKRTGVAVRLNIPETVGVLPEEVSLAFFRTAQQCLSNLHRHSGSRSCKVRLELMADRLELEVADKGRGIPAGVLAAAASGSSVAGVGITGMRDRLQQLGGRVKIHADRKGTQVIATLPRSKFAPDLAAVPRADGE